MNFRDAVAALENAPETSYIKRSSLGERIRMNKAFRRDCYSLRYVSSTGFVPRGSCYSPSVEDILAEDWVLFS